MRILHITDLHYSETIGTLTKQNKLVEDFLHDISSEFEKIDFVIFSGDLVNTGFNSSVFKKVERNFLNLVVEKLNLKKTNFFFCPGNHDVDRSKVSNSVIKYLDEEIDNNSSLNIFFKNKTIDLQNSFLPLKNYYDFLDEFYKNENCHEDHHEEMYSVHIRNSEFGKTGFVSINSAWRSVGINDDNSLLYPISKIDEALDKIIDCNLKILIHHHPLSDFKPFNKYELEDLLHKRFDFIFSGHIHKNNLSIDFTHNEGVVKIGSSASLTYDHDSQIGYTVIDISNDDLSGILKFRMYDQRNEVFYSIDDKTFDIPSSQQKIEQNKLRKNIRKKRFFEELEDSKNLFVENENDEFGKNLLELSTEPVLKEKSQSEIVKDETGVESDFNWSNFHKFEKDYIIFGKDKCGKTILLKKIELELLDNYSLHNFLPLYIDIKNWKNSMKSFELKKELTKYYFLNQTDTDKIIEEKNIVLLIDNYQVEYPELKKKIEDFVVVHENVKLIICSLDTTISTFEINKIDGRTLNKLHFHRLRKIHIKELAKRNSNLSDEKQEQIVDKIDNIFKKLSIPFNYWTVSIFLWIFKKDINANFDNDVDLINLYIEKLIEKEHLTITKSRFSYANYKKLLAHIAHFLLTKFHSEAYYAKYTDLINFIDEYLGKNPRYNISSKEVFEYLENKGIFRKRGDDQYSFRLNGVFEYFIAYYMTIDKKFLDSVVKDDSFYLSFTNEFELYAGFNRDDQKFLKKIYKKTTTNLESLWKNHVNSAINFDQVLISKMVEVREFNEMIEKLSLKLKNGLSEIEQDQLEQELINEFNVDESNSEVKSKQFRILNDSIESLESTLQILGRVYKNTDEITDVDLVYEIFDYIIDSAILWSFKLIDEFKDNDINDFLDSRRKEEEAKFLLKVLTNFIPTLVQVRLNEMLGHNNLEQIISERLEDCKKEAKKNQFKIFILGFLLTDINIERNKNILEELIPLINIPIIKYSFILKMNYYLSFKTNSNKELKKLLQKNIQSQYLKFNNEIDLGGIHKGFSEKQNKKTLEKK